MGGEPFTVIFPDRRTILFFFKRNFKIAHFEYQVHGKHDPDDKTTSKLHRGFIFLPAASAKC